MAHRKELQNTESLANKAWWKMQLEVVHIEVLFHTHVGSVPGTECLEISLIPKKLARQGLCADEILKAWSEPKAGLTDTPTSRDSIRGDVPYDLEPSKTLNPSYLSVGSRTTPKPHLRPHPPAATSAWNHLQALVQGLKGWQVTESDQAGGGVKGWKGGRTKAGSFLFPAWAWGSAQNVHLFH